MNQHNDAEILRFGEGNQALLDILGIYALKNKTNIPDILILEIGLAFDDIEDIFNHQEISEEKRQCIDEWIKNQRAMHRNVLSSQDDEVAIRRMGKSATAVGTLRGDSIDYFGDGPIHFFDDDE
ncbi:MAG: hypothetical protein Q7T74_03755 [Candidatus Saccharibacteria bacterium]|nr:hypothetical protein [Candidatus Saccharibacteria bacterium]